MDILKSLTDENMIAEESIIKNLIEKFKKYKKEKKEEKKLTVEEIKARDWSYRKKDYESFIKKAKPIVDKYVKEYPKVFKETFNYSKSEFLTGSEEYVGILTWDLWEFNPEARTNEDKNNEFYALYDKVIFELKDAAPAGYIVAEHGDWDDGLIVLVDADISRAKLKESATESIDLLSALTNEDQIAEEGIISSFKDKVKALKEKNAKLKAERLAARKENEAKIKSGSYKPPSEEEEEALDKVIDLCITVAKKELSKISKELKKYIEGPDELERSPVDAVIEIMKPMDFYYEEEEICNKLWQEWFEYADRVIDIMREKTKNDPVQFKFNFGDGDEGCIYIRLKLQ